MGPNLDLESDRFLLETSPALSVPLTVVTLLPPPDDPLLA